MMEYAYYDVSSICWCVLCKVTLLYVWLVTWLCVLPGKCAALYYVSVAMLLYNLWGILPWSLKTYKYKDQNTDIDQNTYIEGDPAEKVVN